MAIRIQQYNTPPRRTQAGGIDPGFSNPLIRDAGRNGTALCCKPLSHIPVQIASGV